MKLQRFVPPRISDSDPVPFENAEEAWFWGVKGVKCRMDGARMLPGMSQAERPCEAVDVVNCATQLRRSQRLSEQEIAVLFLYGQYNVPPRILDAKHAKAAIVWEHALNVLGKKLEQKGIIKAQKDLDQSYA